MDEYISKEHLKQTLLNLECKTSSLIRKNFVESTLHKLMPQIIDDEPVADVQPVKHGRWIETHISLCKWIPEDEKEEGHSFYMAEMKCSCCERYNTVTFALTLNKPDFCQLCGARMDGDEE